MFDLHKTGEYVYFSEDSCTQHKEVFENYLCPSL